MNKRALLVVSGKQDAHIYEAVNGTVTLVEEIDIETPHYSGDEGFSVRSGKGVYVSGSSKELRQSLKEKLMSDYIEELASVLKKHKQLKEIYLFTPSYMHKHIESAIPATLQKKVREVFLGNFLKTHPFKLLEKINRVYEDKKIVLKREEAQKILKNTKQANGKRKK